MLHGEPVTALGSFGLRLALPTLGWLVGIKSPKFELPEMLLWRGTLAVLGGYVATALDLTLLKRRRADKPTAEPRTFIFSIGGSFGAGAR